MAAAEAKLDAKVKALNGLKSDIQGLLTQTDQKEAAEVDRMVKVFEGMKPKDAAPRMVVLDDSVRLPIAAKMKERSLSGILALMPPAEAKRLTESLAKRFSDARDMANSAAATANQAANQVASSVPLTPDPVESSDKSAKPARGKASGKQAQKAAPSAKSAPAAPAAPKAG
jgi:hypothetical protein